MTINANAQLLADTLKSGAYKQGSGALRTSYARPDPKIQLLEGWMHEAVRLGFILAVALVMVMVLCSTLAHLGLPHFARCIKWVTDRLP